MKILKLRFKNLNSLHGEWSIDFTSPQYISDGIFAITGPTGAGKSTILDAICLALYGRTPRLKQISQKSNEIMSRQTGECFSEVTFETDKGRFRCHWSQAKARKKTDGNLLDSKHEISDDDSGNVIESKKRDVAKAIEERTGMDFDRFTRSILLAQGGFAAFLQASPDDRAPILEDITGTEIYTVISKKVHEIQKSQKEKLEILKAETSGIQILEKDEEIRISKELKEKQDSEKNLSAQNIQTSDAIIWHKTIKALEEELALLEKEASEISSELENFKQNREKLAKALIAAELDGQHGTLMSLRQQQKKDIEALSLSEKLLPEKEEILAIRVGELNKTEEILSELKENQKKESEIIKNIRTLDLQIKENEKHLNSVSSEIKAIQDQIAANINMKNGAEAKKASAQDNLAKNNLYISENPSDSELVSGFTGIKEKIKNLKASLSKKDSLSADLKKAGKQIESANSALKLQEKQFEISKSALEKSQADSKMISGSIFEVLQGKELKKIRDENDLLKERQRNLDSLSKLSESIKKDTKNLSEAVVLKAGLNQKISGILSKTDALSEKRKNQEREITLIEDKVSLLNRIRDLESERQRLEDGKPCPLCGSPDHPFAKGNIPEKGEAEEELSKAKTALKATDSVLSSLNITKAGLEKDLEHSEKRILEFGKSIEQNKAAFLEHLQKLGITERESLSDESICKDQDLTRESTSSLSAVIEKAEKLEDELKAAMIQEKSAEKTYAESEKNLDRLKSKKNEAESDSERIKKAHFDTDQTCTEIRNNLLSETAAYGFNEIPDSELDKVSSSLEKRLTSWLNNQKQKTETEKLINEISNELNALNSQFEAYEANLKNRQSSHTEIEAALHELKTSRIEIYGTKNPDHEERRLGLLVAGSEADLAKARLARDEADRNLHELTTRILSLKDNIEKRGNDLNQLESDFMKRLEQSCFDGESDYLEKRLSKEERDRLANDAKDLDTKNAEIMARHKDRVEKLEQERERKSTSKSLEELSEEHDSVSKALNSLVQEMGGIKQRLADNESARLKFNEKLVLIEKQKTECSRWDDLHDLIGSADGKKFRNFAQGLTFEIMVSHANRQLGKMTDRYLLIRDDIQPLELNVVDNYQAGEIRSTKNLSGGESFIVSLSLALGLSHMASRKVRVDSLFLDEGFGTLDEEALETALETLSSLQQDGKLIGVISHVSALKERISTRINVQPISGGKSEIYGPGCEQVK
ncbi:AAA family ATPase [Desulforegula conservatrix]|uniref:AAA family ATPase n=1 Tax=Desulforegula conservatrix TaxID=153026 RepID=UPI00040CFBF9|nr:AAA family ATPase [Desulforegula conservatrix]